MTLLLLSSIYLAWNPDLIGASFWLAQWLHLSQNLLGAGNLRPAGKIWPMKFYCLARDAKYDLYCNFARMSGAAFII
ncbi:hypothetical protein Pmani_028100 [Petrolisthes manimaculis]|uniref:Uncharacterized protein n=1 Tax=Petrolisthes manimaculis TaxID=1843537 RepID=A0AAE1P1Q4_9EUCA|nr:hypothetical protein Pmani_028100 [Petrolisthes manimaculis]